VTTATRSPAAPQLPTMIEAGVPGFAVAGWYGVLAPAGTPAAIIAKLNKEMVRILHMADVRKRLAGDGSEPVGSTPEEFAAHIKAEIARWRKVIVDRRHQAGMTGTALVAARCFDPSVIATPEFGATTGSASTRLACNCRDPGLCKHATVAPGPRAKGPRRSDISGTLELKGEVLADEIQCGITLISGGHPDNLESSRRQVCSELASGFYIAAVPGLKSPVAQDCLCQGLDGGESMKPPQSGLQRPTIPSV
jgi:hypothetical protein